MSIPLDRLDPVCVPSSATIGDAVRAIDENAIQIALIIEGGRVCGTLTDGDVRRAMLHGFTLMDPVTNAMNPNPKTALAGETREAVLLRMKQFSIRHMPVVDESGTLLGLETIDDLCAVKRLQNHVVLMAGGFGRRLAPLTDECPKPMLQIGGRPILETVLMNFIEYGFQSFSVSVNYRAEMIMDYFGDGSRWGVRIDYLRENEPLGTAGALSLLKKRPDLPLILMNADILTKVNFHHLLDFHAAHDSRATMCVREYQVQVPYGVIKVDGYHILEIQEKPTERHFVNAGIYVLDPEVLDLVPRGQRIDMTELFSRTITLSMPHAVFPLREYWIDVGQHLDFRNASADFERTFG